MTIAFTATPEPANLPPRTLLEVEYTGQATATVTRLDPDGVTRLVRLADPATLTAGVWTGYDYESFFGEPATYTATTGAGSVSATPVTLDVATAWLRHPGIPSLSIPIDFQGDGTPVRTVNQAIHEPIGRREPIVVSDGRRKSKRGTMTLYTYTPAEAAALLAILDDVAVLLLDIPPAFEFGITHEYRALGDLTEGRFRPDYYPEPRRVWTIPFTEVGRPPGGQQSLRTYGTILDDHVTYLDVYTTYDTYGDVLTGTT